MDFEKYKKDPRIPCKYGNKCYQKNSSHHNKYKHPPKKQSEVQKNTFTENPYKKRKLSDNEGNETNIKNDIKESPSKDVAEELTSDKNEEKEYISDSFSEDEDMNCGENTTATPSKMEFVSDSSSNEESNKRQEQKQETMKNEEKSQTQEKECAENFDPKIFIRQKFLVDMPEDFYEFWDYCKDLTPNNPTEALKDVGLKLVGPYDVLAGKFNNVNRQPEQYLRHWRYYYDPPELQTILKGADSSGYHIGYFRDSPDELPVFLVSNHGTKDGILTKMGENIFAAVSIYLEELKKTGDPFKKMHVGRFLTSLHEKAKTLKLNLSSHTEKIRKRDYKVVTRTFNKIGLVVPYNKKTELGYRSLAMSDKELQTLLSKLKRASPEQKTKYLSDLQPVLTFASIALDECDFGTGIELGWNLICSGVEGLEATITRFLSNSYRLLDREAFAKIAEAHFSDRKKGCDLSIL